MKILTKKILRDIKHQKGRSLSIIIIISIAMGLYSGLLLTYVNVDTEFVETENDLNLHSARFVSQISFDPEDLDMTQFDDIKAWDTRLSLLTSISFEGTEDTYTSPLYGIELDTHPKVSDFIILDGEMIQADDEILMENKFMESNEIELGDTISIKVGETSVEKTVVGSVFSPEYFYKVNPKTGLPDLAGLAPIWASQSSLQSEFSLPGVNELLVRYTDSIHLNQEVVDDHIDELRAYLEDLIGPGVVSIELSDEPDQQMKEGDLGAVDDFARVFGGVVLLIALFAIYDNISKLIANQRNYIGTMRALGGSRRKVARHYTFLAFTLAAIGVIIGIPLSWVIAVAMVSEYAAIIGVPEPSIELLPIPIMEGVAVHLGLSLIIAVGTSMRAAGITPREAMSSSYITQVFRAKPLVERFIGAIGRFEPTTAIPIRNIFRNKRKSLLTIFTYSMSIVLMVSALAFIDSFNHAIDYNYDERQLYDLEIHMTHSLPSTDLLDRLDGIDGIKTSEPFSSQEITVENGHASSKTTSIYAFAADSKLRAFDISKGSTDGLVVSSLLADDLNITTGDSLKFLNTSMEVAGIAQELVSESIFLDLNDFQEIQHLGDNATGVIVELEDGADADEVADDIRNTLPVAVIVNSDDVKQSIQVLIQGLFAMIGVMVLIGFLTVALFSFNTIVLEIISRENEFVNIKSLGSPRGKIVKIIVIQSLIVAIAGSLISIPLSYLVSDQVIQALLQGLMNMETVILPESYIISIGSALLASFTGVVSAYKHVMNIDLVQAMRNRVSN